jgi:hypothetical protein
MGEESSMISILLECVVTENGTATFILDAEPYTAVQYNLEHNPGVRKIIDDLTQLAAKALERKEHAGHPSSTVRPG